MRRQHLEPGLLAAAEIRDAIRLEIRADAE